MQIGDGLRTRLLYEAREKAKWDEHSRLQGTIERGATNKAIEIAKKALELGMNIADISNLTGLTAEEMERLQK